MNISYFSQDFDSDSETELEEITHENYPFLCISDTPIVNNLIELSLTRDTEFNFHVGGCFDSIMPNLEKLSLDLCYFDDLSPSLHQFPILRELFIEGCNDDNLFALIPT